MATLRNPVWGRRHTQLGLLRFEKEEHSLLRLNKKWEERAPMLTVQPSVFLRADINWTLVSLLYP